MLVKKIFPFNIHKLLQHIYEPAEDSFLMIDALEHDLDYIRKINPTICVEIGSGSGINITALANVLKAQGFCIATDINPWATKVTKSTASQNKVSVEAIQMDLVTMLSPKSVDVLIFNPPYVPTSTSISKTQQSHDESNFEDTSIDPNLIKSWAGGKDGREVMDRVINSLDAILSSNGVFYLMALKENKVPEILKKLGGLGFFGKIIKERQIRGEHLFVIKIVRLK